VPQDGESYALGAYESAVKARVGQWTEDGLARRIWQKDFTVWSTTRVPEITDRLGWLRLPDTMEAEVEDLEAFAAEVRSESFEHVVLLGMGGSSLAPEVYKTTFGNRAGYPRLTVLDSTHPDAVRAVRQEIDPRATLFVVASKSGTTIETLCFFRYFYHLLSTDGERAGSHFIAITDPGTPLERLAAERGFRRAFLAPPDVGGRYSALSHFGLVPAALIGLDIGGYIGEARRMAGRCASAGTGDDNPGLFLGAALGELVLAGRDKITLVTSPSLQAFPGWLEQLIAESTGKDGKGMVPVAGEPLAEPGVYDNDRLFAYVSLGDQADPRTEDLLRDLASNGHPVVRFYVAQKLGLASEMFRWEMAVASASALLGVHPFNQPDVQEAKTLARKAMSSDEPHPSDEADAIPVESEERIAAALQEILAGADRGDYLSLQAYIAHSPESARALQAVRESLRSTYRVATTLGFGPRFLHSTGQLHKGGPNKGIFIQLVDRPHKDLPVPETDFTFGSLISAQSLGDLRALRRRNRRVIRIELGPETVRGLERLLAAIESAG
jgi:transaldolase/glucose-6-phosphate isomerase